MLSKLQSYTSCPICNSKKIRETKLGYLNRYSEQLSDYFLQDEKKFNSKFKNLKCEDCNLIFKSKWFEKKELNLVFNKIVPLHPKGWDRLSKRFNKKQFRLLIDKLKKLLRRNNKKNLNRTIREILSYFDSITFFKGLEKIKKNFINYVSNKDFRGINLITKKITKKINQPADFSRFKGFESDDLINFVEDKIGKINSYSEIGCPLWGNLNSLTKKGVNCYFIKGKEYEFWGKNCKKGFSKCTEKLNKEIKKISAIEKCKFKKKKDFIGIFLYLDHVKNPKNFFSNIFKNFNACGIILENSKNGVPIQHFTGWSKKTLTFISKKFKKNLDNSFKPLYLKDKTFYLMY